MRDAPDELSLAFLYLKAPAEEGIPEHLHGELVVAIAGMYAGPLDDGREAAARDPRAPARWPTSSSRCRTRTSSA